MRIRSLLVLAGLFVPALAHAQIGSPVNIRDGSTGNAATVSGNALKVQFANADTVGTPGTLNAGNTTASVAMAGDQGCGLFLAAGTLSATIVPEVSYDGGTTWIASQFYNPTTQALTTSAVFTNPNAATELSVLGGGGVSNCRVRVSSFTSGTATATMRAVFGPPGATTIQGTVTSTISGTVAVTQSGTWNISAITGPITPGTAAANLGKAEDVAAADGDTGVYMLTVRQDVPAGSTTTDGDYQSLKTDSIGRLWVHIAASDNTQTVSGTVTANAGSGTFSTNPVGFSSGLISGQATVTNSAVALGSNAVHSACVKSINANSNAIYVGPSGVATGTGFELQPGDEQCWAVTNTNQLFLIDVSGSPVAVFTGI